MGFNILFFFCGQLEVAENVPLQHTAKLRCLFSVSRFKKKNVFIASGGEEARCSKSSEVRALLILRR